MATEGTIGPVPGRNPLRPNALKNLPLVKSPATSFTSEIDETRCEKCGRYADAVMADGRIGCVVHGRDGFPEPPPEPEPAPEPVPEPKPINWQGKALRR